MPFRLSLLTIFAVLTTFSVQAQTPDIRFINLISDMVSGAVGVEAPRLHKTHEEVRGEVTVETWLSEPSQVRLVLDTMPGRGMLKKPALLKASLERPLTDKPSPYDGGLLKTLRAFLSSAAAEWDGKDQQAFAAECRMVLETDGCDRTLHGVRVTMKMIGPDRFRAVSWRP